MLPLLLELAELVLAAAGDLGAELRVALHHQRRRLELAARRQAEGVAEQRVLRELAGEHVRHLLELRDRAAEHLEEEGGAQLQLLGVGKFYLREPRFGKLFALLNIVTKSKSFTDVSKVLCRNAINV